MKFEPAKSFTEAEDEELRECHSDIVNIDRDRLDDAWEAWANDVSA